MPTIFERLFGRRAEGAASDYGDGLGSGSIRAYAEELIDAPVCGFWWD